MLISSTRVISYTLAKYSLTEIKPKRSHVHHEVYGNYGESNGWPQNVIHSRWLKTPVRVVRSILAHVAVERALLGVVSLAFVIEFPTSARPSTDRSNAAIHRHYFVSGRSGSTAQTLQCSSPWKVQVKQIQRPPLLQIAELIVFKASCHTPFPR